MKIGIVQQTCSPQVSDNIAKSLAGIKACAEQGAELVVLQELHCGIYFCQAEDASMFDLAEPIPGPAYHTFSQAAKENNVVLVSSLFEKRAPGIYHNTAVVFEKDGTEAGRYRKMHIPDDPAYYEKFYFTPGDLGFNPIATSVGKLGVLVCWDQWYPEAARLMAMRGAEVLIYPTAIGWADSDTAEEQSRQFGAWQTIQRGHAVANGLPVIAVNRTGWEKDFSGVTGGIRFWGQSFIAGAQGEIMYSAPIDEEVNYVLEVDKLRTEQVRRMWPFFRDRRIDAYDGLTKRYLD